MPSRRQPLHGHFVERRGLVLVRAYPPRRSARRRAASPCPAGCPRPLPACRPRRASGARRSIQSSDSRQLASVCPESPAIRSMLMLRMPASRSTPHLVGDHLRGVLAPGAADLLLDERLHAQADAVDAALAPSARAFSGVMLPGAASMVASVQGRPGISSQQSRAALRAPERWACRRPGRRFPAAIATACARISASSSASQIARFERARKHARREIAVGALLRAERIGDVDSRHSLDCSGDAGPSIGLRGYSLSSRASRSRLSNGRDPRSGTSSAVRSRRTRSPWANRNVARSSGSICTM